MKRILLGVETCLSLPVFVLVWWLSSLWFAARAGWLCAQQDSAKKTVLLDNILPTVKWRWRIWKKVNDESV